MFQTFQDFSGFGSRADVAGMLILEADDEVMDRRLIGEIAQSGDDSVKILLRFHRSPVGEDPHDMSAEFLRDCESLLRQTRLILKCVLRCEDVVLKPAIDFRRSWKYAFEQR